MADTDNAEVEVPEEGVVEIPVEGAAAAAAPAKKVEPEPKPAEQKPTVAAPENDATKSLQTALDNERRLRQAAEQTATTAAQLAQQEAQRRQAREAELEQAQEELQTGQLARITAGIESAQKEIASAQKELSAAYTAGEFEKAAEVQTRLGKATAALDRWENQKADFESGRTKPVVTTTEGRVTEQPTAQPSRFDHYISGMAPAAQTWLRAHPECAPVEVGGKPDMNAKMMRGHYDALSKGYAPNSDEYFKTIEESTGYRKNEAAPVKEEEVTNAAPRTEQRRQASPSAPPSREVPGSPQTGTSRTVRLSKEEQETARLSFPHMDATKAYAEYAKNKLELTAEGKLGRTSH